MVVEKKSSIARFYLKPGCTEAKKGEVLNKLRQKATSLQKIETELCYHVETAAPLSDQDRTLLKWVLQDPFHPEDLREESHLVEESAATAVIEVGPRFNFSTPNSTNAVSICRNLGLMQVVRLEVSRRYLLCFEKTAVAEREVDEIASLLYDRMTECRYTSENIPRKSFNEKLTKKENIKEIDVLGKGESAIKVINDELGLAFDEADFKYYTNLFKNVLKRNPTNVELFDLAQSNSEHSRHWFFKGKMIIDGVEHEESLIDMIVDTQKHTNPNNVIKFSDNSSAIKGYIHRSLRPITAGSMSELRQTNTESHLIFTAETHNFPTGVAPFSGATTGTGGRIRDVQCVGRGGYCIAGTAGYSVGNLNIPDYTLPWEDPAFEYPNNFAPPLEVLVEASNGASDYGNKFGEPLISGFVRSFGLVCNGERKEWIKPIMFSGGIGSMEAKMTQKLPPKPGHQIIKIGGPVYRIGVGGGSASSIEVQGDNKSELDFNAVQRGDAEMEQKLNRVVRACLELGKDNPVVSIHDQGAGGNGNVLKELVEPVGGIIYANRFELGDPTINVLELWGAEYQENNALLCDKKDLDLLKDICKRERCPINVVGEVTGTGRVVLTLDETQNVVPFDLELSHVLGKMPRKVFKLQRKAALLQELKLPDALSIYSTLERVLRLPSVASKRYLTNKVDRCVTGLIAQQQCVGPLHTPLADVAVTAISHFGYEGVASSIGEQPIKGLVNTAAGARMTVAEALSNLVFAVVSDLKDVKCSGNWMWAAKLPGEGAALFDACKAMCDIMCELGIAIDGGKDSLSMAARVGRETVKAPGTLVVSTYAPCPDVRKVVTPDFKVPATGKVGQLLFVDLSHGFSRVGGTAVAQVFGQLGKECPDIQNVDDLKNAFIATQELIKDGAIQAGHDVSDGGLITCLLEMCFAGISGMDVQISHRQGQTIPILFSEEVGWVLEVLDSDVKHTLAVFKKHKVPVYKIGKSVGCGVDAKITISVNNACIETTVLPLMRMWEETSYKLELHQTIKTCADSEYNSLTSRSHPKYKLTFDPDADSSIKGPVHVNVAVLREEGTNGDREMAAALVRAGFKVWDVTMQDLLSGTAVLDRFRGVIFPGGFSYADVLGSAKGWAGSILFNPKIKEQFDKFYSRPDTFSLGVCNGCQLMGLIGWVGEFSSDNRPNVILEHNVSERFECRWSTVKIEKSRAIMLKDMEDSVFGVWVAHGEGRFTFKNSSVYDDLNKNKCVGLRFTDDNGQPTEIYPMNPNGSIGGIAGICSNDGRHLAMMPHPERCDQLYQWPYLPSGWQHYQKSPWERMFRNAFDWCCSVQFHQVYY
ncbi:phosphoribosylformylglycinamidine synthase-like [Asbolus verrucosus]|uniref:Phosphoribosylformylglycinamidine synthase n=1 Tax=Asbolus verrucosus TaxID=1661398 RepID=A0A482WA88_ASBVE|nr:phosphoribosylformylglycinamidine synthase-like [Asbolus verrucosus]